MKRKIDWTPERKHFRAVTEDTDLIAWATDVQGYCFYLSPEWYSFTGAGAGDGEGTGFSWMSFVHSDDVSAVRQAFFHANDTRTAYGMAYRLERNDGEYVPVWSVGLPKFGAEGAFEGFFGTICLIGQYQFAASDGSAAQSVKPLLTEREREILRLISHGNTTDTVAAILGITGRTVDTHVANAGMKLSASNRVHTVATALRLNEI